MRKLTVVVTLDRISKNGREGPDWFHDPGCSCDHAHLAHTEVFSIQEEAA